MNIGSRYYWMLVSQDKYEWPLVIADTCGELAMVLGVDEGTIRSAVNHSEHRGRPSRYRRVLKEEGGDKNADA